MKNIHVLLLVLTFSLSSVFSQNIDAQFDICQFQTEKNISYLETYLSINTQSVVLQSNENGTFQANVIVSIQFKNSDNQIVKSDKYSVFSAEIIDTNNISLFFIDQQRYLLADGTYQLILSVKDANDNLKKDINYQQKLEINSAERFSDIQLIDAYNPTITKNILSKSGYDLTPFVSNFYNQSNDLIKFYYEYYPRNEGKVLIRTSIISNENKKVVHNLAQSKWSNVGKKTAILSSFPIEKLHSSSYMLVTEAINKDNKVIDRKERLFYKINEDTEIENIDTEFTFVSLITSVDTLRLFIQYLYPIENAYESTFSINRLKNTKLDVLQKYFYKFWNDRAPFTTEESWLEYLQKVNTVNRKYNTGLVKGFLTDRGRIELAYGQPNSRTKEYFPKQFQPFEVWHYYKIGNERDIKFIFTNTNNPNVFNLVYSNKTGEVSDNEWQDRFESNFYDNSDNGLNSPWDSFQNPK